MENRMQPLKTWRRTALAVALLASTSLTGVTFYAHAHLVP